MRGLLEWALFGQAQTKPDPTFRKVINNAWIIPFQADMRQLHYACVVMASDFYLPFLRTIWNDNLPEKN